MIDITQIVVALIGLLSAILTAVVVPYIKKKYDQEKLSEISTWVTIAVEAAEQIFEGSGLGQQKKAYVLQFLNEKGFSINADEIDAMIESAVLELNSAILDADLIITEEVEEEVEVDTEQA